MWRLQKLEAFIIIKEIFRKTNLLTKQLLTTIELLRKIEEET